MVHRHVLSFMHSPFCLKRDKKQETILTDDPETMARQKDKVQEPDDSIQAVLSHTFYIGHLVKIAHHTVISENN